MNETELRTIEQAEQFLNASAPWLYSARVGRVVSNGRSLSACHPIYRLVEDSANHARP